MRTLVVFAVLAALFAGAACGASHTPKASAAELSCPVTGAGQYVSCVRVPDASPEVGQQITDATGSNGCADTPWMVTDYQGAPMAWVNCYGLYSGGDGGRMPGGLICVSYGVTSYAACLTPTGTLELTPTGPHGPTGPTVTLTPADIRFLHHLEARS